MNGFKLGDLLIEMSEKYEEQPAFLFPSDRGAAVPVRYSEFINDLERGVIIGGKITYQRIAILGYNSYSWILTAFSLLLSGKSLILLDPGLGKQDLIHLLEYTDAECLMISPDLAEELSFLSDDYYIENFLSVEKEKDRRSLKGLSEQGGDFLCFTSGTSKSSKGVVVTADVFVKHILLAENVLPGKKADRFFLPLPLHHMYALTMIFHIMKKGAVVCLGTTPRYLRREADLFDADIAMLVPSMIDFLFQEEEIMPRLYAVILGGSRFRKESADKIKARGIQIVNIYGSSETAGFISCNRPGEDENWLRPYGPIQFVLRDTGELGVRLPFCMEGYYKRPDDTKLVLNDGCFWTGDAGRIDEEGRAMILGRIRDTIVIENGEKIHAEDIDSILNQMEGVRDAAVVYAPQCGLCAVIVAEPDAAVEVIQKRIAAYNKDCSPSQKIRHIWYREEKFPRTATGKLKRYKLENEYQSWSDSCQTKED